MAKDVLGGGLLQERLVHANFTVRQRRAVALAALVGNALEWYDFAMYGYVANALGKVVQAGATPVPDPVFVFTDTLLWSILIDALDAPLQQVNANKALLAKINFPRDALILTGVYQTLFNCAIKVGILLLELISLVVHPGWRGLLIPVGLLSLELTGTAVGLLHTPLGVLYGDIGRGIPLITQFLMCQSPVVFPLATTGWSGQLMGLNPLTPLILNARPWFTGQPIQRVGDWALAAGASLVLLLLVWVVYWCTGWPCRS